MRIAFFVQHLLCGGVEKTLLTLTQRLANDGHQVMIYVIRRSGGFISSVPKGVTLAEIPLPNDIRRFLPVGGTKMAVRDDLSHHHYWMAIRHLIAHKFGKSGFAELNVDFSRIPNLSEEYDIAVNYHLHSPFLVRYLSEKVTAKRKYSWIHNDFSTTGYDIAALRQYLSCCDGFFGVAERIVDEFRQRLPEFAAITHVAHNLIPADDILRQAEEFVPTEFEPNSDRLNILTVGRIEEQKGYDIAIEVCRRMMEEHLNFRWFVIGDGSLRQRYESLVKKLNLKGYFVFLGTRLNPYPYFKHCDLYVQTSRHEGYVTTVTEAKLFARPIVCTDVSGAREQLTDGVNGEIAKIDADDIYNRVSSIIKDKSLRDKYSAALSECGCIDNEEWLAIFNDKAAASE